MPYAAHTQEDRRKLFEAVGVRSFEELITDIPQKLRIPGLSFGRALSEMELLGETRKIGQKNAHMDRRACFLGAGVYDHYIPSAVGAITSRGEFMTAYTPYQGEASQGTLQTIYEYQTMISMLTGMDVANASMYDGASAAAEAAILAVRAKPEAKRVLIAEMLHPEIQTVIRTHVSNLEVEIAVIPSRGGVTDPEALARLLAEAPAACAIFQSPNFLGYLEPLADLCARTRSAGAIAVASVNPLSLSVVPSPGDLGADIAVGDGQPLGNAPSYGGPHFGFFAVKNEWVRKIPGRIAGLTRDREGARAFVLTLQAREQHIRREKATSNICTNHALCALKGLVYLAVLGPKGFRRAGELNLQKSHDALEKLLVVGGVKRYSTAPFFNEFAVVIDKDPERLAEAFAEEGLIGPLHLGRFRKEWQKHFLVAVTEQRTDEEVAALTRAISRAE